MPLARPYELRSGPSTNWAAWETAIGRAGAEYLDTRLNDDAAAWATAYGLADGWTGTLEELATAAMTL